MPEIAGRHYMNPAYGRTIAAESEEDGQESSRHGELKHISVHSRKGGGFAVHAHYQHERAGHHTVDSKHASAEEAAEEVKRHLRGTEKRQAARTEDEEETGDTED